MTTKLSQKNSINILLTWDQLFLTQFQKRKTTINLKENKFIQQEYELRGYPLITSRRGGGGGYTDLVTVSDGKTWGVGCFHENPWRHAQYFFSSTFSLFCMSRVHCVSPEDKHKDYFLNILNILLKFTLFLDSLFRFSILGGEGGDVKMTQKRDVTGRGRPFF